MIDWSVNQFSLTGQPVPACSFPLLARERPINAEVPAGEKDGEAGGEARRRRPKATEVAEAARGRAARVPLPLKLVGGAILLAAVFLVAAILGGGNGRNSVDGAAPLVGGDTTQPEPRDRRRGVDRRPRLPRLRDQEHDPVGGGDPAANAAGAALAVFPATDEAQRPAAVTLVDEADPEAAIAAAVLMSAPVRAPILVAGEDGMPAVSAEALAALDPAGSSSTGGASVFAIGDATGQRVHACSFPLLARESR